MVRENANFLRSRTVAGVAVLAAAVLLSAGPAASEALKPRALPSKSIVAAVGRVQDPRTLIIKLKDGAKADARAGRVGSVLAKSPQVRIDRAISVPKELLDAMRLQGELATGEELADLSQFYVARVPSGQGMGLLEELLQLDEVENAYADRDKRHPVDLLPPTPNFQTAPPGQGYRGPAPAGIGIDAAWAQGFRGQGVTVVDVEANWNLNHEDLDHLAIQTPAVPIVPQGDWPAPVQSAVNHGTASLGVLAAGDNGYGTTGLVPSAKVRVVPIARLSDSLWNAPNAVVAATLVMRRGDVMLLEVENPAGEPFETYDLEFAVVRQATALGIHVVEPAGNTTNGFSLDTWPLVSDPATGKSKFDWTFRDSGAILVAGGESAVTLGYFHYRYVNSNCGTRVDAFSWGQNITTLGYGAQSATLANCANPANPFATTPVDPNQLYTYCYNGTSGAGAIVAGAVAALEQKHVAKWGRPASVRELRNHLRLGTAGTSARPGEGVASCAGGIGHQPDLSYHLSLFDQGGIVAHSFKAEPRAIPAALPVSFGAAISSPGDVDGDGLADIAVGVPGFEPTASPLNTTGRVYLFSAKSEKILWTADGSAIGDRLGQSLAALGDVDNDGVGDLAAGAPSKGFNLGSVSVLAGATGAAIYTIQGTVANGFFGAAVSSIGDINNDGVKDFVVGSPGSSSAGVAGRVQVRSGSTGALIWSKIDPQVGSDFGFAVAGIGDLNGDGIAEVIVGAPIWLDVAAGKRPGAVTLLSGATGAQLLFLPGEIAPFSNAAFGVSVAGVGDLTGDGVADFAVGAPGWTQSVGTFSAGKFYLYRSDGTLLKSYTGLSPSARLGSSVAGGMDWNGDGWLDVAVGQPGSFSGPGAVFVYQGPFTSPVQQTRAFPTKDPGTSFGAAVAFLGDTNGDGLPDIGAGEPSLADGRAFVFASGPAPGPLAPPKLVADVPAIEAFDVDGDGNGGGGLSPSFAKFHLDAGAAWSGADYQLIGVPKPPFASDPTALSLVAGASPYLAAARGTLDGNGKTRAPVFGPIPKNLLCPGLAGAEFDFVITLGIDADGDGVYEKRAISNPAAVTIIHEFPGC